MKAEGTTKRPARINVKVAPGINRDQANKILSQTPGLQSVIHLFPDETDEEMLRMYILEVNPDQVKAALKQLDENPELESSHETAPRALIW